MAVERELNDEEAIWSNNVLPAVLDAIGSFEGSKVYGIRLHFEYGRYATATIMFGCGSEIERGLSIFGTNAVSAALAAPRYLQAITVDIQKDCFVIINCRYAPTDMKLADLVNALAAPVEVA